MRLQSKVVGHCIAEYIRCLYAFDVIPNALQSLLYPHTGQCKRTGGCYNELVVAFFSTGGGVKGKKSIPVDFIIYL